MGAFVFMAAALFASAIVMLFVKRPAELVAVAPPSELRTPVGAVLVPLRAVHGGWLKTC